MALQQRNLSRITRSPDLLARKKFASDLQARSHGVAIMMYSTDLDEVIALADRMLVVYAGTVREVIVDPDVIGRAMLGALE